MIEKIKNISQEYKHNHEEIPWGDIIGFRNGIVHEYGKTDYTTVYEIITVDIYTLQRLFSGVKNWFLSDLHWIYAFSFASIFI